MAIETELSIRLLSDTFKRESKALVQDTNKILSQINFKTTITAISAGFDLVRQTAQALEGAFNVTLGEAIKAEKGVQQLAQSMKLVGDFSEDAVKDFVAFADSLEEVTGISDDAIIAAAALAKNFGLVNSEAELAVNAALELSVATGRDLNSAIEEVSKTFSGFVSRDLGRLIPALRTLSKEQLIAGEGARLIQEGFKGTAEAAGSTAAGEINKFRNALSDLGKEIGQSSLPFFTSLIAKANEFVKSINAMRENSKELARVQKQQDALIQRGVQGVGDLKAGEFARSQKEAIEARLVAQRKAEAELAEAKIRAEAEFQTIKKDLETAGLTSIAKIQAEFDQRRKVVQEAFRTGVIRSEEERIRYISNLELEETRKINEERKRLNEEAAREGVAAFIKAAAEGRKLSGEQAASAGLGVVNQSLRGQQGATDLVATGAGAAANAILPGSGGVVSEIARELAKGPEHVQAMVEEFVRGIPRIITNVLTSIPRILITLVKEIPRAIIEFIKTGVPEIISAFIVGIPEIITTFVSQLPSIAIGLVGAIIEAVPRLIQELINGFGRLPGIIVDAIADALSSLVGFGDDGGFLSNIPIVGGLIEGVGDFLGFAQGGRVPNDPAFEGDKFPARLNAGEQILSKDLSSRLEDFLTGGGSSGPTQITLQIGQKELASVLLDLNNRGFRTA